MKGNGTDSDGRSLTRPQIHEPTSVAPNFVSGAEQEIENDLHAPSFSLGWRSPIHARRDASSRALASSTAACPCRLSPLVMMRRMLFLP